MDGGLCKTLTKLHEENANVILITNPQVGDHRGNNSDLINFVKKRYHEQQNLICGVLLTGEVSIAEILQLCGEFDHEIALIHTGFSDTEELSKKINSVGNINAHIFIESHCGKLYQKHFKNHPRRIIVRDGLKKMPNRKYRSTEFFSELHVTYRQDGATGLGDFLIVGNEYSEASGQAYAVTIHLTYIDPDRNNEMHIKHFKSDRQDTPVDPGGKFAEALNKLISEMEAENHKILKTRALVEFQDLHQTGHYPGLGYVKKLSMLHHIETLVNFF